MRLPQSRPKNWILPLLGGVILLVLLSGIVVFLEIKAPAPIEKQNQTNSGPIFNQDRTEQTEKGSEEMDQAEFNRFLGFEERQKKLEQTVWKQELESRKYEDTWIELWDVLRYAENPEVLLGSFPLERLHLGSPSPPVALGSTGIQKYTLESPMREWSSPDWKGFVDQKIADGYILKQSEWRHPRFFPGNNKAPAKSHILFSMHLYNTNRHDRIAIDGRLQVEWKPLDPNPAVPALPEEITVLDAMIIRDQGPPPYQLVFSQGLVPDLNPVQIDPLILYDLNYDGLPEVIFGSKNRIYWNRGGGRFEMKTLVDQLPEMTLASVIADFDGDGVPDFLCADRDGLLLFKGEEDGEFRGEGIRSQVQGEPVYNPYVLTCGDMDGDGDLDVWCAQYKIPYEAGQMPTPYYDANDGFPSYLWVNNGEGRFEDRTEEAGLGRYRYRRTYSASFVDLDNDGDLDLINVSDFAGLDAYRNNGRGHFVLATSDWFDETRAFGMAHTMGDFNMDGYLDFFMIGMHSHVAERLEHLDLGPDDYPEHNRNRGAMFYGNRMYFSNGKEYEQIDLSRDVARTGWSWGATSFDWDNDGDLDIYIVNGHKSRRTARDYERQFWTHDIYAASSSTDPAWDLFFKATGRKLYGAGYSYGGYEKNRFLLNQSGKGFVNVAHALDLALEEDGRNLVSGDLDGDGRLDIVLTTSTVWPRRHQGFRIYRNTSDHTGNWIGIHLREEGAGYSPVGAEVRIYTTRGESFRRIMTGDSFRSQHANTAHFGLGHLGSVQKVEVKWLNGKVRRLENPEINRFYTVLGRE